MAIQAGEKFPEIDSLTHLVEGRKAPITTKEIFSGKKVVLFAVPGAFTPTCSGKHLPGYINLTNEILSKSVDSIVCVSVNDAYVMKAWSRDQKAEKIKMLSDGNGDLARALGLEKDGRKGGMGVRSQRYAMIVEDGVVTTVNVEAPGEFEASKAETILGLL